MGTHRFDKNKKVVDQARLELAPASERDAGGRSPTAVLRYTTGPKPLTETLHGN